MVNVPSSPPLAVVAGSSGRDAWRRAAIGIVVVLVALGFIFRAEAETAIYVWVNSDAYNHCFLVLPVAAYLLWQRRMVAAASTPRPSLWIALLALPAAAGWFAAERLGVMEGRQLMAMTLLQLSLASLLGLRTWRALAAPLLYLFFLV